MPTFKPVKPAPAKLAAKPAPVSAQTAEAKPVPPVKITEPLQASPEKASEKPLDKAGIAAAATRARMAEIMGPRRRQGQSSAAKDRAGEGLSRSMEVREKMGGGGEKEMSEPKGDEVKDLLG